MTSTDRFAHLAFGPRRRGGFLGALMAIAGLIAGAAALAIGAVLAVFTAVAVAVIGVVATVLLFLANLAMRSRRPARAAATPEGVIEARKVGDTWVTYGWERHGR